MRVTNTLSFYDAELIRFFHPPDGAVNLGNKLLRFFTYYTFLQTAERSSFRLECTVHFSIQFTGEFLYITFAKSLENGTFGQKSVGRMS